MIGGGEFIINGAERVVVSQLHRSPRRRLHGGDAAATRSCTRCRIIPERGSWIEINVTKKDTLGVRIDQSGKFSAMTLLRAMGPEYSTNEDIIRVFYETVGSEARRGADEDQQIGPDRRRRRHRPRKNGRDPRRAASASPRAC